MSALPGERALESVYLKAKKGVVAEVRTLGLSPAARLAGFAPLVIRAMLGNGPHGLQKGGTSRPEEDCVDKLDSKVYPFTGASRGVGRVIQRFAGARAAGGSGG